MAKYPSLPLMTDAYIADTQHLTNEEHGVYLRLLMFAWRSPDCRLPDDDRRLAIMVGVTARKWASLKPAVMEFWDCADGFWTQKKLLSQRDFVQRSLKQKSEAGIASAKAKALKNNKPVSTDVPTASPTDPPTESQRSPQQSISISRKREKREPNGSPKKKGSRLSEDWVLPKDWGAWALAENLSEKEVRHEAEKFRDYWIGASGARAVKRNWQATWRNWIRTSIERRLRAGQAAQTGERGYGSVSILRQIEQEEG